MRVWTYYKFHRSPSKLKRKKRETKERGAKKSVSGHVGAHLFGSGVHLWDSGVRLPLSRIETRKEDGWE